MPFFRTFLPAAWLALASGLCWPQTPATEFENRMELVSADSAGTSEAEHKSPTGAMLRSLAIPGWGQWYNEQKIKAVLVVAIQGTLIGFNRYYHNLASKEEEGSAAEALYVDRRNLTYWLMGGVVLLSMIDAYIDAHLFNFDTGPDLALRIGSPPARDVLAPVMTVSLRADF